MYSMTVELYGRNNIDISKSMRWESTRRLGPFNNTSLYIYKDAA